MALKQAVKYSLTAGLFLAIGCSFQWSPSDPLTGELANKGVVGVYPDKKYLASSQFLERESQNGEAMKAFLTDNGSPAAIDISATLLSDLSVRMYYPTRSHFFDLTKNESDWIITGPFPLGDSEVTELQKLSIQSESQTIEPAPEGANPPEQSPPAATPEPQGFSSPTQTKGQKVLDAETTPKGDVVHYVTLPGESLSIIARWYTRERDNAGKIGRLNKLKDANQLEIGDVIVIPSYLVKNKRRFTADSLREMETAAQKGNK